MKKLADVKAGEKVLIVSLDGGYAAENRLFDMGLIPGEIVEIVDNSGFGPIQINVKGSKLAIGHGLANKLVIMEEQDNE